jgi:hypothetical protein
MKIPQLQCSPSKQDTVCEFWLAGFVGDKRLVGKRKAGTFKRVGLDSEETSERILVLSVKDSGRETLMLLIAAGCYRASVLVRVTERRLTSINPLSVKNTVQLSCVGLTLKWR